jgi:hypothetical protein
LDRVSTLSFSVRLYLLLGSVVGEVVGRHAPLDEES